MSGSVISGVVNHGITIGYTASLDTYAGPLSITAAGRILAGGTAQFAVSVTGAQYLTNNGYISGGSQYGVNGALSLTNYSTIVGAAITSGYAAGGGVYVGGRDEITNFGLLEGGAGLYGSSAGGVGGHGLFNGGSAMIYGTVAGGVGGSSPLRTGQGGVGVEEDGGTGSLLDLEGAIVEGGVGGTAVAGGGANGGVGGEGIEFYNGTIAGVGVITGGNGGNATEPGFQGGVGGQGIYVGPNISNGLISGTGLLISGGNGGSGYIGGKGGDGIQLFGKGVTITGTDTIVGGAGGTGGSAAGNNGGNGGIGLYITQGATITLAHDVVAGGAGGSAGTSFAGFGGAGVEIDRGTLLGTGTITGGAYVTADGVKGTGGIGLLITNVAYVDLDAVITGGRDAVGVEDRFGTFINSGIVTGGAGALGVYVDAGTVINAGTIVGTKLEGEHAELGVDPGAVFEGGVSANFSEYNSLALYGSVSSTLTGIGTSFYGFSTIDFAAGSTWEIAGDLAGFSGSNGAAIDGFTAGDHIVLDNEIATSFAFGGGLLTLSGAAGTIGKLTIAEPTSITSAYFQLSNDGTDTTIALNVNCFAAGTRILTPAGEVPVEHIRVGDEVVTLRDPARPTAKVIWTGRRSIDLMRAANVQALWPVRIAAGAFGQGVPARDLRVSPHHAIYCDGALFEAISLVNGVSIVQEPECRFVTYHHLEVEGHDVLLAEGLPAESYLDTGGRENFEGQVMRLHPVFQAPAQAEFCAPMIREGAALVSLRAHLARRAAGIKVAFWRRGEGQDGAAPGVIF
jgi:hypothetical protein